MSLDQPRFSVIGENIHATRVLKRGGQQVEVDAQGRAAIRYVAADGSPRLFTVPDELQADAEASGKVRHVQAAIVAAMGGGASMDDGLAYLGYLVRRQVDAGAAYLDLNVDELSVRTGEREAAMAWLVMAVASMTAVPVSLDSSAAEVIASGIVAWGDARRAEPGAPAPLLNSASLERLDVLDLAAEHGCPVVIGAAGATLPANAEERIANALRMSEQAADRGIPLADVYLDPLVLPVATDPEAGRSYLDAVAGLRAALGPDVHVTGGLSNVSFGLPLRRLLNEVFIDLAIEAGADSGIIDPVANDLGRVRAMDRASPAYRLAADALSGRDPYCMAFLAAYRRGELVAGHGAP
jgi:hypothetical protein